MAERVSAEQAKGLRAVAFGVPDGRGGVKFGKGWGFAPSFNEVIGATEALYNETQVIRLHEQLAALSAEVERLREDAQWRPIETAPHNTWPPHYFLMYGKGGYFDENGSVEKGLNSDDGIIFVNGLPAPEASHWKPLPEPPAQDAGAMGGEGAS